MPTTSTSTTSGNLDLSFIKSLFGSNPIPTTTTATTPTKDAILNQSSPTIPTVSQQHKEQQIERPQSQPVQNEFGVEKQQQSLVKQQDLIEQPQSSQQASRKQHVEQRSLPQEQCNRPNVESNLTHGRNNAPDMTLPSASPQPRPRKKEGKRQRLNRLRQKRKHMEYDNFDNNTGKPNDDLDFDGLLALHETKKPAKDSVKSDPSTTSQPVSTANQSTSSPNLLIDHSLRSQPSNPLTSTQQSSATDSTTSIPTKKQDISTQEAAFLSNLWDSLSKGNGVSEPPPPLPQQSSMNTQPTEIGHQSNPTKKRKNGQGNTMAKKQKKNTGNLANAQSANGQPSMTDIALEIIGKPRNHLQQKQGQNRQQKKGGQHQGSNNHQKHTRQHPSSLNSINNSDKIPPTSVAICKYYTRGNCAQGDACKFKHEGKPNQVLCKFYKSGSCANGANCTFSHDLQLEPCRFFFVGGSCDAGDHCVFSHAPLTDDARKELHKMTGPCRFYHFKGYCANGNECVFSHTEIADDKRHELELTLTPCRHFHTQQVCPKGDDCFYLHEEAPAESVRLFKESLAKQQQKYQHRSTTNQFSSPTSGRQVYPPIGQHAPPRPPPHGFPPVASIPSRLPAQTLLTGAQMPISGGPVGSFSSPGFDPRLAVPSPSRDPRLLASNQHPRPSQNHTGANHH